MLSSSVPRGRKRRRKRKAMDTEASVLAIRTALNEIKNMCPGISNIFVLNKNKQVLAQDQNTTEELMNGTANYLTALIEKTGITGGIESLTYYGADQRINFTNCDDNYFVTAASNETDENTMTNLTRVLVPTMLKLAQGIVSSHEENPTVTNPTITTKLKTPTQTNPELSTIDLPASEFVVETLSGLSIISTQSGTIRVDRALIGEWKELYGDKKIEEAMVEGSATGKRMRCRFQAIKESKQGQGVVQIPDRMQANLGIKKGEVVLVRPIIVDEQE